MNNIVKLADNIDKTLDIIKDKCLLKSDISNSEDDKNKVNKVPSMKLFYDHFPIVRKTLDIKIKPTTFIDEELISNLGGGDTYYQYVQYSYRTSIEIITNDLGELQYNSNMLIIPANPRRFYGNIAFSSTFFRLIYNTAVNVFDLPLYSLFIVRDITNSNDQRIPVNTCITTNTNINALVGLLASAQLSAPENQFYFYLIIYFSNKDKWKDIKMIWHTSLYLGYTLTFLEWK